MASKKLRIFLDTSALMAGLISAKGAAREVLRLAEAEVVETILSRQVLEEADRNFKKKFPDLRPLYHSFLRSLNPTLTPNPSTQAVRDATQLIHSMDAPILAAALESRVDYLITWNTRHFMKSKVTEAVPFKIVTPGEFLEDFRTLLS